MAGQGGGEMGSPRGEEDEEGGMDGLATRQRGEKRGCWWAWWSRRGGRQLRCTSLSSLCPTPVRVWKKKRVALQRPSPPASHPPPHTYPSVPGHLWARGVGSGGKETACTLTYCHIQLQSKLRVMAMKDIFLLLLLF